MSTESNRLHKYLSELENSEDRCIACYRKSYWLSDEGFCPDCQGEIYLCDICNGETEAKDVILIGELLVCPECHNEEQNK